MALIMLSLMHSSTVVVDCPLRNSAIVFFKDLIKFYVINYLTSNKFLNNFGLTLPTFHIFRNWIVNYIADRTPYYTCFMNLAKIGSGPVEQSKRHFQVQASLLSHWAGLQKELLSYLYVPRVLSAVPTKNLFKTSGSYLIVFWLGFRIRWITGIPDFLGFFRG